VEIPRHRAQILRQRRRLRIEGGEDQSAVAVELRHRHETPFAAVEFAKIEFFELRDADQASVVAVGPAVIGAGKTSGVARGGAAQTVAAMPADIQEGMDLAVTVADHQNRVLAHIGSDEVAGLRNLALMAQKQPAPGKDLFLLGLVDFRLNVNAAADETTLA